MSIDVSTTRPAGHSSKAKRHIWLNFTRMSDYADEDLPIIVRGEGCYVYDERGNRFFDGLSGLFCVNIGHGRTEIGEAAKRQLDELGFAPTWGAAHPAAADLAERIAAYTPGDLNRVMFTSGGSESVEAALKLARQYHVVRGEGRRTKVIARDLAYHGCTMYATSATGLRYCREPFEPLLPGALFIPNTDRYRSERAWTAEDLTAPLVDTIEFEGPETVAAVIMEPVQCGGGCFVAPPGYYERVREICDQYGVLLIADEVITGWGRVGDWFACRRFGFEPDLLTTAKGLTSAYAPLGALVASDRVIEPFLKGTTTFQHGHTFSGHPLAAAIALANIEIMEREELPQRVREQEGAFRQALDELYEIPLVGDIRGAGYLYGIELVRDQSTKTKFKDDEEVDELLGRLVSRELHQRGYIFRTDKRGEPMVTLSPPLICGPDEFRSMVDVLGDVLQSASDKLGLRRDS